MRRSGRIAILVLAVGQGVAVAAGEPPTRYFPFEEIGCLARGAQLAHDRFGRVVVAQQGEFIVLNDSTWQKLWSENTTGISLRNVRRGANDELYYGAFGSWGVFVTGPDGKLQPRSLVPQDAPAWVRANNVDRILWTERGVFFSGLSGVVFHGHDGAVRFFEIEGVSCVFPFGARILVSTFDNGVMELDLAHGTSRAAEWGWPRRNVVVLTAGARGRNLLVATGSNQLLLVRTGTGEAQVEKLWQLPGTAAALTALPEGGFAVAVSGVGLMILTEEGQLRTTLSGRQFAGITALESHETGVLWAAAEGGLLKVLHAQPFTTFGRDSGLLIDWPQVVRWQGRPLVASGGRLYEANDDAGAGGPGFRPMAPRPGPGIWGVVEMGGSLLVASGERVFSAERAGEFNPVVANLRAARLVRIDDTTCLAIGNDEIAALRRGPTGWVECAERAKGVGYPYIVHTGPGSAWVELGLNRLARIAVEDGAVRVRLVEEFPWAEPCWVNVSIVGTTAIFCGSWADPVLVDERTLAPVAEPALRRLFAESPRRIQRLHRDERGVLWASHDRGLLRAEAAGDRWELDVRSYAGINGPTPRVVSLPGGDIWVSTGSTLHRLQPAAAPRKGTGAGPTLVALRNSRTNTTVPLEGHGGGELGRLAYADNSLQLEFFAGGYAAVRPFGYEFRLGDGEWSLSPPGSSVFLPDLPEGRYRLGVRTVDDLGVASAEAVFGFEIAAPWYRTVYAYGGYGLLLALLVVGVQRLSVRRVRLRQAELERQVAERTGELRAAMERLRQETQTSATLAERNRLAAEIHDSLEQGFTGLSLQLETTAELPGCSGPVRSGVDAALSMVGYCRKEIRHAIRGLHSPILGTADLATAIRQLATQLEPNPGYASVEVVGRPRHLDSATEHHLLRIVQEAVTNAVKHAEAKRLEVVLEYAADGVRLTVRDDGRGFRPDEVASGHGGNFGLPSFRTRAHTVGGSVEIDSRPGAGTTVRVWAPYTKTQSISP